MPISLLLAIGLYAFGLYITSLHTKQGFCVVLKFYIYTPLNAWKGLYNSDLENLLFLLVGSELANEIQSGVGKLTRVIISIHVCQMY